MLYPMEEYNFSVLYVLCGYRFRCIIAMAATEKDKINPVQSKYEH